MTKGNKLRAGDCTPLVCSAHPNADPQKHWHEVFQDDYDSSKCQFICFMVTGEARTLV